MNRVCSALCGKVARPEVLRRACGSAGEVSCCTSPNARVTSPPCESPIPRPASALAPAAIFPQRGRIGSPLPLACGGLCPAKTKWRGREASGVTGSFSGRLPAMARRSSLSTAGALSRSCFRTPVGVPPGVPPRRSGCVFDASPSLSIQFA